VIWFHRAAGVDGDGVTGAAERAAELEGLEFIDLDDEDEEDQTTTSTSTWLWTSCRRRPGYWRPGGRRPPGGRPR
jgi:hypothetical protein